VHLQHQQPAPPTDAGQRDRELVRRCVAGDALAWRTLYDDHFPAVERLVVALGIGGAEGDDVCQEIFLLIYRDLRQFRGEAKLSTWIHRLASREAIRFARKRRLREKMTALFARERRETAPPAWTETAAARRRYLEELLAYLTPERRLALVLYEAHGVPVEEIARIAGCAENTIWTRLHRARVQLSALAY
jgi:RNA polymerase sigma-70 factor (ECF subfamily)